MKYALIATICLALTSCVTGPITGKNYYSGFIPFVGIASERIDWKYYDELRELYIEENPDLPMETKVAILDRKIHVGMTARDVEVAWALRGIRAPARVNRSVFASGVQEQWVLGPYYFRQFLYFDDGILTGIQQ